MGVEGVGAKLTARDLASREKGVGYRGMGIRYGAGRSRGERIRYRGIGTGTRGHWIWCSLKYPRGIRRRCLWKGEKYPGGAF